MPGSKSRGHFRKTPKQVVVIPATQGRTHMEKEKEKPVGPPPPPPGEGTPRESPLGPGEHQDEPPAEKKE